MGSEREQIVKWLREQVLWTPEKGFNTPRKLADAIERGDHLPTERTDNGGQHE
jgi:hypothetical protein